jgi:hypothetical protein
MPLKELVAGPNPAREDRSANSVQLRRAGTLPVGAGELGLTP